MDKLERISKSYDYIRFSFSDINGTARGKVVPKRSISNCLPDKLEMYAGAIAMGHGNDIPFGVLEEDIGSKFHMSCKFVPIPETIHPIPWSGDDNDGPKVAEVFCEPYWKETNTPMPAPRNLAGKMLKKLDEMGYELLSGTEQEFKIYKDQNLTDRVPISSTSAYGSLLQFGLLDDLMYHLHSNLEKAEVYIENLECECSPGQFELVLGALKGITAADKAFTFQQGARELILKKGYGVSFLAKPDLLVGAGNGGHFNFSIWDKKTGKNAFYDADTSDNLSSFAKHWIAGFIKHAPALTALCSPTVNCYRRIGQPWAPGVADWNLLDRGAMLRVKNDGEKGTYMENRVPSSIANPYIVMAATLAAGIDGIIHQMSPPSPHDTSAPKLPSSLADALNVLEADTALTDILGKDFLRYFIGMKREIEITKFGHHDISKFIETELAAELREYEFVG